MSKVSRMKSQLSGRNAAESSAKQVIRDRFQQAGAKAKAKAKEIGGKVLQGVETVGRVAKRINDTANLVAKIPYYTGVMKGIFNHPDWYKYKGQLSIPAHNIMRPFNARALKEISPIWDSVTTKKCGSGLGVTHIVHVNVKFNDMRNEEAFQLATMEAFKAIRLDLKSNLPYKQVNYDNYVMMASSILVKAKMIEKVLGYYNFTRADIPEFTRATQTVPYNTVERGVITPTPIDMISELNYANTLNQFKILKSMLNNIAIPKKLAEYVSWWVGSMFADQAAPNPQLYTTMLRDATIFHATDMDTVDVTSKWDVATGGVQEVIDEAKNLLNVFGVMNADIIKTGRYGICDITLPQDYSPVLLNDYEFFSILINSYGVSHDNFAAKYFSNDQYVRVDALEELNESNLVGMANALSKWSGYTTLCSIISMACYLDVDSDFELPSYISSVLSAGHYATNGTSESDGAFIQVTGLDRGSFTAYVSNTAAAQTITCDANTRNPGVTISAATTNIAATTIRSDPRADRIILIRYTSGSNTYELGIKKGTTDTFVIYTNGTAGSALTYSGTITRSGHAVAFTTGTLTLSNTQAGYFTDPDANWTDEGAKVIANIIISYTTLSNGQVLCETTYNDICKYFCELVDYHIPMICQNLTSIYLNGARVGTVSSVPVLMKECYKPMLFNYADIKVVLYWMYLGLFSME